MPRPTGQPHAATPQRPRDEPSWAHASGWAQLSGSRQTVSCVLPCRDKARTLSMLLPILSDTLTECGYPWEVIVIDCGSIDGFVHAIGYAPREAAIAATIVAIARRGRPRCRGASSVSTTVAGRIPSSRIWSMRLTRTSSSAGSRSKVMRVAVAVLPTAGGLAEFFFYAVAGLA